ncbi:MAG: MarR family EPS-associated transcriptional regulator [Arenimonas sp.]|uniref:MarR family EPS-associated transcriptional regulator n=1 Tax=Arenimonas sp. TaxID=1872635 RepID=UPI003C119266
MSSRQKKLQEDTEFRVLRMLEARPDATQRDLAENAGISVGALNYCLKALIAKGMVKMQNFSESRNKFGYVYVLTPDGLSHRAALTQAFLKRKLAEYAALQQEIESLKRDSITPFISTPVPEEPALASERKIP